MSSESTRDAAPQTRVDADGSVDAENAPTDPCKTTERFCTSSHTPHRPFLFQKTERPEHLRALRQLPTDSAEEATSDAVHPEDLPRALQIFPQVSASGEPY